MTSTNGDGREERPTAEPEAMAQAVGLPFRMSWGAVFGGAISALGVLLLLYALGLALGLTTLDPAAGLGGIGMFTGVWGIVTAILALFVGGFVAGRGAGRVTKGGGALHGLVMWGLTTVVSVWLLASAVSALVGGVASLGGAAVRGAGNVTQLAQQVGIDAQDILSPINERLRAEGRPEVTVQQLEAAVGDVIRDAIRQGQLDRQLLVQSLTQETALTQSEAQQLATRIEERITTVLGGAQGVAGDVAQTTATAFWTVFGAMLLGLLAAMLGATVGVSKRQRFWAEGAEVPRDGRRPRRPRIEQPRAHP